LSAAACVFAVPLRHDAVHVSVDLQDARTADVIGRELRLDAAVMPSSRIDRVRAVSVRISALIGAANPA